MHNPATTSRRKVASLLSTAVFVSFASLSSAPSVLADAKHGHNVPGAHTEHGAAPAAEIKFNSVGEAWTVLQITVQEMQSLLDAKDLKAIHPAEEKGAAAIKYLQTNSSIVTGDKAKRLEAALRQAAVFSTNVHVASDAGDQAKTEAELKKLFASLKLVQVQYPAEALKAPEGLVKYQCPMKDFTGEKPGDCPQCGMKLKAVVALAGSDAHGEHEHGSSKKAPTMQMAATSVTPLMVGQKANVTVRVSKKDGSPVTLEDLEEAHTEKIHLLVIDPSLTDYHHEHPVPAGKPGEYTFSFTPRKPGPYRIWADLIPVSDKEQEYVIADLAASTKPEAVTNRTESLTAKVEDLTYTLTFKDPLVAGEAILGTLTIKDGKGNVVSNLEPLMGAYAHIVGFSEDYKTIAHIHPMGEEPTKPSDRGAGELKFHLMPEQAGLVRLFAQVQIGGVSKFAPFTLNIKAAESPAPAHSKH